MNTNEYRSILEQLKRDLGNQLLPVGCIMMFPNESVPDGFMPCDGSELPIASYPELYAVIGQTFKPAEPSPLELYQKGKTAKSISASETIFHLPDMRGLFVRGWDRERNVDSDTDRKFGGLQEDALQGHSHEVDTSKTLMTDSSGSHSHTLYSNYGEAVTSVGGLGNTDDSDSFLKTWMSYGGWLHDRCKVTGEREYDWKNKKDRGPYMSGSGNHSHKVELHENLIKNPTSSTYGEVSDHVSTETRPKNIALTFCIKVK